MKRGMKRRGKRRLRVAAGVIRKGDKLLLARRGPGDRTAGCWEFPGGTIEAGEEPEACLERELWEELGVRVRVTGRLGRSVHTGGDAPIELHFLEARIVAGKIRLRDHDAVAWVGPAELRDYRLAPADREFVERQPGGAGTPIRA
jgi:8-oxo-dGTP diphosphatase